MRRLLPPVLLIVLIAIMAVTHRQLDVPVVVPASVRQISLVLVGLGLAVAMIARAQFARVKTTIHTFDRPRELVTDGIFRLSRNPMYVGLSLVGLGAALWCGAVSSLVLAAVFVLAADRWYIPFEEKMMKETFGGAFDHYAGRTRRWL
jgi:protein-S-isoprenylcysteine O-methyltransferase Ste14